MIIKRTVVYAAPLIVLGDINIHLDNATSPAAVGFTNILADFDLVQHVTGPTHTGGHTLDVFITRRRSGTQPQVKVEQPIVLDHSMITAVVKFEDVARPETPTTVRRNWQLFDVDAFKNDLANADLVVRPSENCNEFFALYDRTLEALLDKHAQLRPAVVRRRQSTPWYNAECRRVKAKTRRLEKIFRATRTEDARRRRRDQFAEQRSMFQRRYADHWRKVIADSEDSKPLWRRFNVPNCPVLAPLSNFVRGALQIPLID